MKLKKKIRLNHKVPCMMCVRKIAEKQIMRQKEGFAFFYICCNLYYDEKRETKKTQIW